MSESVNQKEANRILADALSKVNSAEYKIPVGVEKLHAVILGSHLTYRYLLITGLLAKATNSAVNPLTLQVGSKLEGAYDARSLCHKVLVPFERDFLDSTLGGSNEPFLNKPARFTELSLTNAVRRGNDKMLLENCIDILGSLTSSNESFTLLEAALYFAKQRESRNLSSILKASDVDKQINFITFIQLFLEKSCEGETSALVAGLAFKLLGKINGRNFDIKVHPTNQSGASSNEIADVDVFENGNLIFIAEIKDKDYTNEDVKHAATKAAAYGIRKMLFLVGPHSKTIKSQSSSATWGETMVKVTIVDLFDFFCSIYSLVDNVDNKEFVEALDFFALKAKVKDETYRHFKDCCSHFELI